MDWRKSSPEMTEFLDRALTPFNSQRKQMFGFPVYFINDNMFAGLHQDDLFIRLSEQDREAILAAFDEAGPFEPMPGRPMKEYVVLPEPLLNDSSVLQEWLERSFQYVSSLPPKERKTKKKSS